MFLLHDDNDDYGIHRADTVQALTWWWRLGASHEATNTLYWAMFLAQYQPSGIVDAIVIDSVTFYYRR